MQFYVVKSKTLQLVFAVIIAAILLSINLGGTASAQVYFNKTNRKVPIYEVDTTEKVVGISFDAAWGADKTRVIMDTLDQYECKATFFLVGFWVDKYSDIVKEIQERGFEIGTHSNTHPDFVKLDKATMKIELETSIQKIVDITGVTPKLFRAPFGSYNNSVLESAEELNLTTIQWSVDSLDWKGISANEICKNVLTKVRPGGIILNHNNSDHIVEALPTILQTLKSQGYKITNIGNMIYQEDYTINQAGIQKKN